MYQTSFLLPRGWVALCVWVPLCVCVCVSMSMSVCLCLGGFSYFFISCGGNAGRHAWIRHSSRQEQRYPFLPVTAVFSCFQTMVWLAVLGVYNVRTYVDARDCTLVAVPTPRERESVVKTDFGRKIPYRTRESNPHQYCAVWLFRPMLYPLRHNAPV